MLRNLFPIHALLILFNFLSQETVEVKTDIVRKRPHMFLLLKRVQYWHYQYTNLGRLHCLEFYWREATWAIFPLTIFAVALSRPSLVGLWWQNVSDSLRRSKETEQIFYILLTCSLLIQWINSPDCAGMTLSLLGYCFMVSKVLVVPD